MFSSSSPANLRIVGAEGHSPETLRDEVARGARFVIYSYNFSLVVMSFKRPSNIYLVRPGENRVLKGLPFTLISLVFGWWGIPWGIIYTFQSLAQNLGGGTDLTDAVLESIAPAPPPIPGAAPSTTPAATHTPAAPRRSFFGGLAAVGLVAGLAAAIYLGVCSYRGSQLPVAIVAGTEGPYQIEVNGVPHRVAPGSPVRLTLSEGEIVVRGAPGQKGDLRFTASTPFFSRPFDQHVLVINPDKAALVYGETARYYSDLAKPAKPEPTTYSILANEAFYFRPEPDYFFEEFPRSISMPKGASVTPKTRLHAFAKLSVGTRLALIKDRLGAGAVQAHLANQAHLTPENEELQRLIYIEMKPDEARKIFESRLADRPVLVEWHRTYQSLMDRSFATVDLKARYRQWMEAEPDNGNLIYLYARTSHDLSEARPLNEKAAHAKYPSNYAIYALGADAFSDGEYERSIDLLAQAEKAGLKSDSLQLRKRDSLLALGRVDEVLARAKQLRAADPTNTALFVDELMLSQSTKPDLVAGQRAIATFVADVRRKYGTDEDLNDLGPYLASRLEYSHGHEREAALAAEKVQGPWHAFEAAVAQRDHAAAEKAIKDQPQYVSRFQWILMLTAHAAGDEAASEKYFRAALAKLEQEDSYSRDIAHLVRTSPAGAAAKILQTPSYSDELRVLFTALGVRIPEQRALYFKRAAELDHDPAFPHLLLMAVRQKLAAQ